MRAKRYVSAILVILMLFGNNVTAFASEDSFLKKSNKEWQEILDADLSDGAYPNGLDESEELTDTPFSEDKAEDGLFIDSNYDELIPDTEYLTDRFIIKYSLIELEKVMELMNPDYSVTGEISDFIYDTDQTNVNRIDAETNVSDDEAELHNSYGDIDVVSGELEAYEGESENGAGEMPEPEENGLPVIAYEKQLEMSFEAAGNELMETMSDDIIAITEIMDYSRVGAVAPVSAQNAGSVPSCGKLLVETRNPMTADEITELLDLPDSRIVYVQPDYKMEVSSYDEDESIYDGGFNYEDLNEITENKIDVGIADALSYANGEGVIVAVLDTGFDTYHEALAGNMFINEAETTDGTDNDGNGFIDDICGWDFFNNTNSVNSMEYYLDQWHGTNVAGIIAAGEGFEAQGVAPGAKILPLKVFQGGTAYTSGIIEAIAYAELMGAKIVNCSWGASSENPALEEAIASSSMLFVCAAGNRLQNIDEYPVYPASYSLPNVISVASVDNDGRLSRFSNYGPQTADVAAPGSDIKTAMLEGMYGVNSGTSMSAAIVSGEAALIYSMNTGLTAAEIRDIIINSSNTVTGLQDKINGGKLINALHAVSSPYEYNYTVLDIPDASIEEILSPEPEDGDEFELFGADGAVTALASIPAEQPYAKLVELNGKIYAIGGGDYSKTVRMYNPVTDTWTTKASMLTERGSYSVAAANGKIYVFGGMTPGVNGSCLSTVEIYNPSTNQWTYGTNLPKVLAGFGAAEYNGDVYIIGGYSTNNASRNGPYSNIIYKYTTSTNTVSQYGTLGTAVSCSNAFTYDGKIYVGGYCRQIVYDWEGSPYYDNVFCEQLFNISAKSSMTTGRSISYSSSGCLADDKIVSTYASTNAIYFSGLVLSSNAYVSKTVAGIGISSSVAYLNGYIYILDGKSKTFVKIENGVTYKTGIPKKLKDFRTVEADGKIYLMGGKEYVNGSFVNLSGVFEYTPGSDTWRQMASMPSYLADFVAVNAYGKIYAFGGGYVYEFNTGTNSWEKTVVCSKQYTSAVFDRGNIYLLLNGNIDIYKPVTGTWDAMASIPSGASAHTLRIADNRIFAFGNNVWAYNSESGSWGIEVANGSMSGFIDTLRGNFYSVRSGDPNVYWYNCNYKAIEPYGSLMNTSDAIYGMVAINDRLIMFSGANGYADKTFEYTPAESNWITLPFSFKSNAFVRGDNIYIPGTSNYYDTANNKLTSGLRIPDGKGHTWIGDKIYYMDDTGNMYEYNTVTGTNIKKLTSPVNKTGTGMKSSSRTTHIDYSAVSCGDKIYVAGGREYIETYYESGDYSEKYRAVSGLYVFDPIANTCVEKSNPGVGNGVSVNGKIYTFNIKENKDETYSEVLNIYNPQTNSCSTYNPPITVFDNALAAYGDKIYVISGRNPNGGGSIYSSIVPYIYIYNTNSNSWSVWMDNFTMPGASAVATSRGLYVSSGSTTRHIPFDPDFYESTRFGTGEINPSGNLFRSFTDMSYTAPGFDVQFSRSYNSRDNRTTDLILGNGWTFGFQGKLKTENGSVIVSLPNGNIISFKPNGDGTYTAKDSRASLSHSGSGSNLRYKLTTKDQYVYEFNNNGYMDKMTDPNGNAITITLDTAGKPTKITDQAGRVTTIVYSGNYISYVQDPTGRTVTYNYSNSRLIKVTGPEGNITTYEYDADGYLTAIKDSSGNIIESFTHEKIGSDSLKKLKTLRDENGNTTTYAYDIIGGKVTAKDSKGRETVTYFDQSLYRIRETDAEGRETRIAYNLDGGINRHGEESSVTDRNGNTTYYDRDGKGNIIRVINPDMTVREYTYDGKNNVTSVKDESGNMTYYEYDSNNNLITSAKRISGSVAYSASANQNNFAVTRYSYVTSNGIYGLLSAETDPDGKVTTYSYDANGYLISKKSPAGNTEKYAYNKIGYLKQYTDANNNTTSYYYDRNGHVLKTVHPDGGTERFTYDAMGRLLKSVTPNNYVAASDTTTFTAENIVSAAGAYSGGNCYANEYNSLGQLTRQTDPLGYCTDFTYDVYGNVLTKKLPNGSIYYYEYDVMNRETKTRLQSNLLTENKYEIINNRSVVTSKTYYSASAYSATVLTYDYAGRLTEQKNPDGGIVRNTYYPNGRLAESTDAMGNKTVYVYDALGRLTEKYLPSETKNGAAYYSCTKYEYDKCSRLLKERSYINSSPLYQASGGFYEQTYSYYADSRLKDKTDGEGGKIVYTYDAAGNMIKEEAKITAAENRVTEYTYYNTNRLKETKLTVDKKDIYGQAATGEMTLATLLTYDKNGNVLTSKDAAGVITTYTYDKMDRQLTAKVPGVNENGAAITITTSQTYDSMGNVLTRTDERGNITSYKYNAQNLLTDITDPMGGVKHYEYDFAGRLTVEVTPQNYVSGQAITSLSRRTYTYDGMGRVTEVTDIYKPYGATAFKTVIAERTEYNYNGNIISKTDALGNKTTFSYDSAGRVIKILDMECMLRYLSYTNLFVHDALGRVTKQTEADGIITVYTYDSHGNILTKKTDGHLLTSNTYNYAGNITSVTDANGKTTLYEYNRLGLLRKETLPGDTTIPSYSVSYLYDANGRLISQTDSMNRETVMIYDKQGRVLSSTIREKGKAAGITESFAYDAAGNLIYHTDPNGNKTTYTYDKNNRLIKQSVTVGSVVYSTSYEYDKNGNKTKETDFLGNNVQYKYDTINRLCETINQLGVVVEKLEYNDNNMQIRSTDALGNITNFGYDTSNRQIIVTDPMGYTRSRKYDTVGRVASERDAIGYSTHYGYDKLGRLITVMSAEYLSIFYSYDANGNMTSQNGGGHTESLTYNARNLPVSRKDAAGYSETYTYFADGLIASKTDRKGVLTTYSYDIYGRLISENVGGNTITRTYDNNGNELSVTDSTGTTTRTYDALNRVTSKTVPVFGTTTFTYDITDGLAAGHVSEKIKVPNGNISEKIYDKTGRLYQIIDSSALSVTYAYYANGALQKLSHPGVGLTEEYTYFADGRLKTLTNKKNSTILEAYSYAYDANGNLVRQLDAKGQTDYTYNNVNQLLTVKEPDGKTTAYEYDNTGDRTKETVTSNSVTTTVTYTYNNLGQLTNTTRTATGQPNVTYTYTYDKNGNMTAKKSGETTVYKYDARNRLISVTQPTDTVTYTYNGDGQMVSRTKGGVTAYYLYEYDKIVLEKENGAYYRNAYGINLIGRSAGGLKYYYLHNGHGDITLLTQNGAVVAQYYYDAFGNVVTDTNPDAAAGNPYLYSGYYYDRAVKLYYLNSRFYSPDIARFITEDTYRGNPTDALSLNLYTYCVNNPLIYWDPSGHGNVGLRDYCEERGATVSWDGESRTATIKYRGRKLKVCADDDGVRIINGRMQIDDSVLSKFFKRADRMADLKKDTINMLSDSGASTGIRPNTNTNTDTGTGRTDTDTGTKDSSYAKLVDMVSAIDENGSVTWNEKTRTATVTANGTTHEYTDGKDGTYIKEGRMYVSRKRFEEDFKVDQGLTQEQIDEFVRIALEEAIKGKGEVVVNNNVKYNTWYYGQEVSGDNYAWCGAFVAWCAYQAGLDGFPGSASVWDYVKSFGIQETDGRLQYNESNNNYHAASSGYIPRAGDLVVFGLPAPIGTGHIGIVIAYADGIVYTVEGNTSDMVRVRSYKADDDYITGYCSMGGNTSGTRP